MIDEIDREILSMLQLNARTPNAEIARRLGMAASAIHERLRKLEARGLIRGFEARLDPRPLGLGLLAFVFVRADESPGEAVTGERLAELPEVLEVHHIAGEDCYLAKVRCADAEALGLLLRHRLGAIPSVRSTRSTIVMGTLKETSRLPLGGEADGGSEDARTAAAAATAAAVEHG